MSEEATLDEFIREGTERGENQESKIHDGWQVHRADEIMEITRGASPRPKGDPELFGGDIPWVKIGDVDVKNARYTGESEDTVTEKGAKKSKLVDEGTLLVSNSGTCGYPMFAGRQSCVHDGWLILRDYENCLNPHYLYEYINWKQNYLKSLAPGSTQINLNTSRFGVLEINTPPLPEQRKIATVLYTVDRAIEETEKLIDQLKRIRQGTMQRVLTQGTEGDRKRREPDTNQFQHSARGLIPHNWELKQVGQIADISYGINDSIDETLTEGIPLITLPCVSSDGGLHLDEEKLALVDSEKVDKDDLLTPGDLLFNWRNGSADHIGKTAYFDDDREFTHVGFLLRIRVTDDECIPRFLWWYLRRLKQTGFFEQSKMQVNKSFNSSELSVLRIPMPSTDEQTKIIDILDSIEKEINSEVKKKNQLKHLKRGLMQDLLSGTVRTTDTNIEVPEEVAQYG